MEELHQTSDSVARQITDPVTDTDGQDRDAAICDDLIESSRIAHSKVTFLYFWYFIGISGDLYNEE